MVHAGAITEIKQCNVSDVWGRKKEGWVDFNWVYYKYKATGVIKLYLFMLIFLYHLVATVIGGGNPPLRCLTVEEEEQQEEDTQRRKRSRRRTMSVGVGGQYHGWENKALREN